MEHSLAQPALVLVLDPDPQVRVHAYTALANAGFGCVAVADPAAARVCLQDIEVDLLVHGVSEPRTWDAITNEHLALGELPCAVLLHGQRAPSELAELEWALRAIGHATLTTDGHDLVERVRACIPARASTPPPVEKTELPRRAISTVSRRKRKLLLVDDSEVTLELLQGALIDVGFDVRIAVAAAEALSIAATWEPDVAIVDLRRPDTSEHSLCPALKANGVRMTLVASSVSDLELAKASKLSGADGYVSKTRGVRAYVTRVEELAERILDSASKTTKEANA